MRAMLSALFILSNIAFCGSAKDKWKYAGEDHGLRFYFQPPKDGRKGPITLKVENTRPLSVGVTFRVRDTDWKCTFVSNLSPFEADSSLSFVPENGLPVLYPFIDRIFVEQAVGFPDLTASVSAY